MLISKNCFYLVALFLTLFVFALFETGCATSQTSTTSGLQTTINDAWTAANKYQTFNNGQVITPAEQAQVLAITHNTGDAQWASIVTAIGNQLGGAIIAAQAAKVNPVSAANAVLAPTNVAAVATSVVSGS